MDIIISDDKKISEVQAIFHEKFPYLKLEFYTKAHDEGEGSPNENLIDTSHKIGDIRTKHNDGELSINGHKKVSTLENDFEEVYGLHVQVFRKSSGIWLQTTATDDWTLSEQNREAELMHS